MCQPDHVYKNRLRTLAEPSCVAYAPLCMYMYLCAAPQYAPVKWREKLYAANNTIIPGTVGKLWLRQTDFKLLFQPGRKSVIIMRYVAHHQAPLSVPLYIYD